MSSGTRFEGEELRRYPLFRERLLARLRRNGVHAVGRDHEDRFHEGFLVVGERYGHREEGALASEQLVPPAEQVILARRFVVAEEGRLVLAPQDVAVKGASVSHEVFEASTCSASCRITSATVLSRFSQMRRVYW